MGGGGRQQQPCSGWTGVREMIGKKSGGLKERREEEGWIYSL